MHPSPLHSNTIIPSPPYSIKHMRTLLALCSLALASSLSARTTVEDIKNTPEIAAGIYYAYPVTNVENTPAPKGYEPFYISHYGRHGSRYMISDKDYTELPAMLHKAADAGALSAEGLEVLAIIDSVGKEGLGRSGELTPLGNRQHHDIATRMYHAYPEVFAGEPDITAVSTVVMRCAHSMFAFIEGLKEQNPSLKIPRESAQKQMDYMNYHVKECGIEAGPAGQWYQTWKRLDNEAFEGKQLAARLFNNPEYVDTWVDTYRLAYYLFRYAIDMQDIETNLDLYKYFTPQELYDMWLATNFSFFARNSSYAPANGAHTDCSKSLIENIVVTADSYVDNNRHGATLRFGHDGNITPLTAAIGLNGCYTGETDPEKIAEVWNDYLISPMAANLQIVLFKNKKGDVIAKIMLNERETAVDGLPSDNFPFYKWSDLRRHLVDKAQ